LRLSPMRAIILSTFGLDHPHQDDKLIYLNHYPTPYTVLRKYWDQNRCTSPTFLVA
jgi:hypothetical protein